MTSLTYGAAEAECYVHALQVAPTYSKSFICDSPTIFCIGQTGVQCQLEDTLNPISMKAPR